MPWDQGHVGLGQSFYVIPSLCIIITEFGGVKNKYDDYEDKMMFDADAEAK